MTQAGLVLLPIEILAILLPWRWVLLVLPTMTIFNGAAVVAVGSFGLQPGYVMAALVTARALAETTVGRPLVPREIVPAALALLAFALLTVVSLWVAVLLFQGNVLVVGGTDLFQPSAAAPYSFRRENLTQLAYLALDVGFVLALALAACRMAPNGFVQAADRGMVTMIVVAELLCLWQWTTFEIGGWWPKEFFASNPGYADAGGQEMLEGLRVNGPFSEPAALAFHHAGFLFYAWARFLRTPTALFAALVAAVFAMIFLSKSTTGLVILAAFAVFALGRSVILVTRARGLRLTRRGLAAALVLAVAIAAAAAWAATETNYVSNLLDLLVFRKDQGPSYVERGAVNQIALDILLQTGGLGIGLGSHKPSSLALTLLSNTGIAGTAAFGVFVVALFRRGAYGGDIGRPLRWFVGGLLLAHLVSNPNLGVAATWMGFGLTLGALGAEGAAARQARIGPAALGGAGLPQTARGTPGQLETIWERRWRYGLGSRV